MVNLNGINSNSQLNTVDPPTAYNGIVWYPFFASLEGRGASTLMQPDGGSWATFKATEMKISANVELEKGKDKHKDIERYLFILKYSLKKLFYIVKLHNPRSYVRY